MWNVLIKRGKIMKILLKSKRNEHSNHQLIDQIRGFFFFFLETGIIKRKLSMLVCCDQWPALFISRIESDLLFFCRSHLAIRAGCGGGLLGVCRSRLLRSSSLFPMQRSKTPPRLHRQRGEKKMNGEANKAPHWGPVLQLSHMSYSPTMSGNHSEGNI